MLLYVVYSCFMLSQARKTKNQPKANAVALYIRVSTEEQVRGGVSLDAQEATLRAYCTMRGLDLVELVVDAGVSAGAPLSTRPGGARVLELVRAGVVEGVVAAKLDRLFRDCGDCLAVTRAWDKRGVALHLVDMGGQTVDTSTAMGRFFLTVMAGAAELERGMVAERTSAAMQHVKSQGRRVGAVPYGFRLADDGRTLVADDREHAVLTTARELRSAGLSLRAVAAELARRGFTARAGGVFLAEQVARMTGAAA